MLLWSAARICLILRFWNFFDISFYVLCTTFWRWLNSNHSRCNSWSRTSLTVCINLHRSFHLWKRYNFWWLASREDLLTTSRKWCKLLKQTSSRWLKDTLKIWHSSHQMKMKMTDERHFNINAFDERFCFVRVDKLLFQKIDIKSLTSFVKFALQSFCRMILSFSFHIVFFGFASYDFNSTSKTFL